MFRIRIFIYINLLLIFVGCKSEFASLKKVEAVSCPVEKFKPVVPFAIYQASVDVLNKHLSGLLVIKTMDDNSVHTLFQSEMGLTYFDFVWSNDNHFEVINVIKQMNKKAVINTLRKDFELMLMKNMDLSNVETLSDSTGLFNKILKGDEIIYIVTDSDCVQLKKIMSATSRKSKVTLTMNTPSNVPDSVNIHHEKFKFIISLKKIEQ